MNIDATLKGNVARFMNHECDSNSLVKDTLPVQPADCPQVWNDLYAHVSGAPIADTYGRGLGSVAIHNGSPSEVAVFMFVL